MQISNVVPQRTLLLPILLLIYISNIAQINNLNGDFISYADDTIAINSGMTVRWNFLSDSLINLNPEVTEFLTFTIINSSQPRNNFLKIYKEKCLRKECPIINMVENIKYLRVIEQYLKFKDNGKYIKK